MQHAPFGGGAGVDIAHVQARPQQVQQQCLHGPRAGAQHVCWQAPPRQQHAGAPGSQPRGETRAFPVGLASGAYGVRPTSGRAVSGLAPDSYVFHQQLTQQAGSVRAHAPDVAAQPSPAQPSRDAANVGRKACKDHWACARRAAYSLWAHAGEPPAGNFV
jgi:hypothetical protein